MNMKTGQLIHVKGILQSRYGAHFGGIQLVELTSLSTVIYGQNS